MRCDQCEMLSIQGVPCHETGCPNARKTWNAERQAWVQFVECPECGCDVEEGESCGCQDDSGAPECNNCGDVRGIGGGFCGACGGELPADDAEEI